MARISFRTDAEVDLALRELSADGGDRSTVIRDAILLAWRERQDTSLRSEAATLVADDDDRVEARRILTEMDPYRA